MGDILETINARALSACEVIGEGDFVTARFRDFMAIPLRALLGDDPETLMTFGDDGLQRITIDGVEYKLWNEIQMRLELLPALHSWFIDQE